jgi:hypothetical protein
MELKSFNKLFVIGLVLIMVQGVFATSLTRSTVSSASAGSTITVTLNLAVTTNLISAAPIENIPEGWIVSDVTGGFMHSEKQGPHRIEWVQLTSDPNVSLTDQSFSYKLHIPANASGTINFDGTVILSNKGSSGSTTVAIGGTSSFNIIGAATTTTSTTTTTTPVPAYAVRTFSSTSVKPGASLTVHVNFVVNSEMMPTDVGIVENVPSGWTISDVSNKGLVLGGNQVTWFFGTTVTNITNPISSVGLTYTISAPSQTGIATFSGTVDYGTGTNAISGNNRVTIQKKSGSNNDDFIVTLPAQSYANSAVTISVANGDSKRAVAKAGVDIYLGSGNSGKKVAYGMTNANGTFTFTPADAGTYTVYVDMSDYREAKETLTVKAGTPTTAPTTTVVTTTQKVTTLPVTTTLAPVTTTRKPTTTAPTTTQAPVTTLPETTTTMEEVTTTTLPTGGDSGSNMLLIGIIVIIIIAAVVFFMMKGKKGKPAENGKKEKAFKASEPKE